MKRVLLGLALVAALSAPAFAQAKITLTQMVSQGWTTEADEALAQKFTTETGIGIEFQVVPADQYSNLLKVKLSSGEAPDIFWIQSNKWTVKTDIDAEKNALDLTNEPWVKTMPAGKIESVSYKGKVYGQGYYVKGISFPVVYNKTLFASLGLKVPRTYAEFQKVSDALLKAKVTPIFESIPAGWHHVLWVMQIGGQYAQLQPGVVEALNANKITLSQVKPFVTAISQLQDIAKRGYFGKDYLANNLSDWESQLAARKAAMVLSQPGDINTLKKDFPDTKDEFGIFLIPLADNQLTQTDPAGPAHFGSKTSKYPEAIKKYFAFLARKENLQYKLDHTDGWTAIDVADSVGIEQHYIPAEKELLATNPKTGIIWQAAVSYVNDQWMEIG